MIEENKDTPVNKPCTLLKHLNVCEVAVINEFAQSTQVFEGGLPV
jgi:hypothetical protein